jgi:acetyltransferase-like isoleucine patch superfamily enzyme
MYWYKLNIIRRLLRVSLFKTIYFNFSKLPFKQAVFFPFIITRNTCFYNLSGNIIISCPVKFGMVRIGFNGEDTIAWKNEASILKIKGDWNIKGDIYLGVGIVLRIEKSAILTTENGIRINFRNKIICYQSITLGENLNTSWEVQIMDSDLHYLKNTKTNELYERHKPVVIGRNVWVGNRSTISKGAVVPNYCTIASNSLCNKKFVKCEYSIIGGIPCKVLKTNIFRPFEEEFFLES